MVTRYEYVSTCCRTTYAETRNETDPMVFPICVQCGQGNYTLVASTSADSDA